MLNSLFLIRISLAMNLGYDWPIFAATILPNPLTLTRLELLATRLEWFKAVALRSPMGDLVA
jgi:hypothetical protein